jgi:hypothetical protein
LSGAKEDEVYVVPSKHGSAGWGIHGIFFRDTCYFDKWEWEVPSQLLSRVTSGNSINEYHSITQADRSQSVGLKRVLEVSASGFRDQWIMTNTTAEEQSFTMQLSLQPRLIDLFALRGEPPPGFRSSDPQPLLPGPGFRQRLSRRFGFPTEVGHIGTSANRTHGDVKCMHTVRPRKQLHRSQ